MSYIYKLQSGNLAQIDMALMHTHLLRTSSIATSSPPQIRSYQSESEDYKTEIDLLKRRIEQLRKRRDYGLDS